jgi:hypothetical protein
MNPTLKTGANEALDCQTVTSAAILLGLNEFDYFRLAYRRWFGEQPYQENLERAFVDYMMKQRVPPWVRMLTWQVMEAERGGDLNACAFGADRYRDRPRRSPAGPFYIAGFAAVWLLAMGALIGAQSGTVTAASYSTCPPAVANPPISAVSLDILAAGSCEIR